MEQVKKVSKLEKAIAFTTCIRVKHFFLTPAQVAIEKLVRIGRRKTLRFLLQYDIKKRSRSHTCGLLVPTLIDHLTQHPCTIVTTISLHYDRKFTDLDIVIYIIIWL